MAQPSTQSILERAATTILAAGIVFVGLAVPASAQHNVDLVNVDTDFHAYDAFYLGFPSGINYTIDVTVCNTGAAYNGDWMVEFTLHGGTTGIERFLTPAPGYSDNIPACSQTPLEVVTLIEMNSNHSHCCGDALLDPTSLIQEDDENNNYDNDNTGTAAILEDEVKTFRFGIINWQTTTAVFHYDVAGLPQDWDFEFSTPTTTVEADTEVFVEYTLTAPGEVTDWPDLTIFSVADGRPGLSQTTIAQVRDAATFDTSCA